MSAPLLRDDAVDGSDERRCRRALAVQQSEPGAPVPLVLGVGRRLEGAPVLDGRRPPHPAPVVASGRGVAAVGRARREGEPGRSTGGHRRAARGLSALRQPEGPRAALPDARGGPSRAARCAAPRHRLCGALALHALAVSALPPPWLPQAPTPRARSGASAAAPQPPGAPRPASGPRPDGRDDRTPVRRRRGVRGEGGISGRVGLRAGHRRARGAPPGARAACLAVGVEGVRGLVAARQAARRRPLGGWRAPTSARVPLVPRPGAVRPARAAWGRAPPPGPCGWRHPGGGSPRRPGAGRANGCADRGRARTAPDAERAPRAVWWWGMRAPGRSRPPRPRPPPKRRPRQPARRPASPCQPGGVLVRRRRQRPAPRRRAGGRASGAAAHALGGLRRSARASWPRPAARGGRGADVQRRWPQPRSSRARAGGRG